jgi:predicted RNase H-like nuclease (RuvC/YqgF family)
MADTEPTQTTQTTGDGANGAPAGQQPQQPQPEQSVPYARFKEVNDQLKSLRDQITALTGEKEQAGQQQQTLEQRLAAIEGDLTKERATNMRLKVASDKKLPAELADRLIGSTAEELAADADRLLAFLKPASGPGVPPPGGGGKPAALDLSKMSPAEIRRARAEGKI